MSGFVKPTKISKAAPPVLPICIAAAQLAQDDQTLCEFNLFCIMKINLIQFLDPKTKCCADYTYDQTIAPRCLLDREKKGRGFCPFQGDRLFERMLEGNDAIEVSFASPKEKDEPKPTLPPHWKIQLGIEQVQRMRVCNII
jgi:hypothetical protein